MPTQGPALWGASGRDNDRGQSHWQRVSEEAGSQGTVRPSAWSANVHVYLSALQLQVKDTLPEGRLSFAGKEGLEEQPLPLDANVLDVVKGRSSDLFASTFQWRGLIYLCKLPVSNLASFSSLRELRTRWLRLLLKHRTKRKLSRKR